MKQRNALAVVGRRPGREGLRGREYFSGHTVLGHRTFFDRKVWLAGFAVEDVQHAGLGGLEPAGDRAAGHRVLLDPEDRHREAVQHVPRLQLEVIGLLVLDVQIVGGIDVVRGVQLPVRSGLLWITLPERYKRYFSVP